MLQNFFRWHSPWFLMILLISIQSAFSGFPMPRLGLFLTDKIVHFATFGLFGWLLTRGFHQAGTKRYVLYSLLIGLFFSLLDELHQSYTPGRDAHWSDLLADGLGILSFSLYYQLQIQFGWTGQRDNSPGSV